MIPFASLITKGRGTSSGFSTLRTILVVFVGASTLGNAADVAVYFSPNGGATAAVVQQINEAKHEILIQAYSFTSVPIASALVAAQRRGLKIEAILDKTNLKETYSSLTFLEHAGIPVYIDAQIKIAHSKIIIIDDSEIITGSFNFTKAAEIHNTENLLILKGDPALVAKYLRNYNWRLSLSYRQQSQIINGYQGKRRFHRTLKIVVHSKGNFMATLHRQIEIALLCLSPDKKATLCRRSRH